MTDWAANLAPYIAQMLAAPAAPASGVRTPDQTNALFPASVRDTAGPAPQSDLTPAQKAEIKHNSGRPLTPEEMAVLWPAESRVGGPVPQSDLTPTQRAEIKRNSGATLTGDETNLLFPVEARTVGPAPLTFDQQVKTRRQAAYDRQARGEALSSEDLNLLYVGGVAPPPPTTLPKTPKQLAEEKAAGGKTLTGDETRARFDFSPGQTNTAPDPFKATVNDAVNPPSAPPSLPAAPAAVQAPAAKKTAAPNLGSIAAGAVAPVSQRSSGRLVR
jgi:hypothetical protein